MLRCPLQSPWGLGLDHLNVPKSSAWLCAPVGGSRRRVRKALGSRRELEDYGSTFFRHLCRCLGRSGSRLMVLDRRPSPDTVRGVSAASFLAAFYWPRVVSQGVDTSLCLSPLRVHARHPDARVLGALVLIHEASSSSQEWPELTVCCEAHRSVVPLSSLTDCLDLHILKTMDMR